MSRKTTFLIFPLFTVVGAVILNGLINDESSPLNEYFLWHVGIPNAWMGLNLIPGLGSAIAAGNLHSGNQTVFYLAFIIQWFAIGLVLSFIASAFMALFRTKSLEQTSLLK